MPAGATAGATPGRGDRSVRMLAAYLDAGGSYRIEGERTDAKLDLRSLRLESHVNLNNEMVEQKLAGQVRPCHQRGSVLRIQQQFCPRR